MNTRIIPFCRDETRKSSYDGRTVKELDLSDCAQGSFMENMVQTQFDFDSLPEGEDTDHA